MGYVPGLIKIGFPKIFNSIEISWSRRLLGTEISPLQQDNECIVESKKPKQLYCSRRDDSSMNKFAIMLSYSGKGYYGIQRNRDLNYPTIEEELLNAMHKAGVISYEHYLDPYLLWFERASRTDKGVSAMRQIVSMKLKKDINTNHCCMKINSYLPPQIRVLGIKHVIKNFDAKENCSYRKYSYMLPTFAFCPIDVLCTESYRLPDDGVEKINDILKEFEGIHNFYNYTSHREYTEMSCRRVMMSCKCGEPFIRDDLQFVIVRITGQSFMMHQIRKMIGMTIGIMRGLANMKTLQKTWEQNKVHFPMAPGLGLLLEEVVYEKYNWKHGGNGTFEPLLWDEYQDVLYSFKEKYIVSEIVETEKKEKSYP